MDNKKEKEDSAVVNAAVLEYRIQKLEEGVTALTTVRDTVLRWDNILTQNNFFREFPIYVEKVKTLEEKVVKIETSVDDIKGWMTKIGVIVTIITFGLQILGPIVVDKLINHNKHDDSTVTTTTTTNYKTNNTSNQHP